VRVGIASRNPNDRRTRRVISVAVDCIVAVGGRVITVFVVNICARVGVGARLEDQLRQITVEATPDIIIEPPVGVPSIAVWVVRVLSRDDTVHVDVL
jgi:hypothetical protein